MTHDPEAQLLERWSGWQRSIEERDADAATDFLTHDFVLELVLPTRAVFPRDQWLATLADYVVSSYDVEEQIVDVDDGLGVILHRARMRATVRGVDRSGVFVITDVWRMEGGAWRVWRRHSTPLTAGELPLVRDTA